MQPDHAGPFTVWPFPEYHWPTFELKRLQFPLRPLELLPSHMRSLALTEAGALQPTPAVAHAFMGLAHAVSHSTGVQWTVSLTGTITSLGIHQ